MNDVVSSQDTPFIEVDIGPVAYEQMDANWLPGLRPYIYQWHVHELIREALERNDTLCLFLVTPTGSGKTLASYAYSIKHDLPALGIYPTNELIADQQRALQPWFGRPEDYRVLRVDSRQLDNWQAMLDLRRHSETLEKLMRWHPVLLTNPDILFYTFFGLYQGPPGVAQRLFSLVGDVYRLFIFDEFHLYNVKQVADVAFLIGTLHRINPRRGRVFVFASATPKSPIIPWLRDKLGLRVEAVEGQPSPAPDARPIAHPLRLTLVPADLARWQGPQVLAENLGIVDRFLTEYPQGRVVTILDAVAGAINVADAFRERYPQLSVGEVHGLSSAEERGEALRRQITVGTSTIEVGIDFKDEAEKDFLIFEARTSSQFIQRFGRIARHKKRSAIPNRALALVPPYVYHFLAERVNTDRPLCRRELYDLIEKAYQQPEEFKGYLNRHAPAEFHAATRFIRSLFQPDDYSRIVPELEGVIQALTGKSGGQAAGQFRRYEEERIIAPLKTFRGAGFEAAILDERGTDPGFPCKRYNLMFLLRRGVIEEISQETYLARLEALAQEHPEWAEDAARERRYAERIGRKADDLLGVYGYFRLKGLLEKGRKVWFEVSQDEVQGYKGVVRPISGLELVTEPPVQLRGLNRFLRRKEIVAWFMDVHPAAIKLGRALPPLFAVYELRVRRPGGALSEKVWSIAFNQDAFFLDSLGWRPVRSSGDFIIL